MKILYVTTVGETMEFFESLIKNLLADGHAVDIATNTTVMPPLPDCYRKWNCRIYQVNFSRNPWNRDNIGAIRSVNRLIRENRYDIVHCHTPVAAFCTRFACRKLREKTKVFCTAHGFHFYHGAPLKNWLFYYPPEWLCSFWTDTLITINREDYERAKKRLHANRVEFVPGVGVDLSEYREHYDRRTVRREFGIPEDAFLLVSVGELNKNKNHSVVVKALGMLHDPEIHYVIAGHGDMEDALKRLAEKEQVARVVHLPGYRYDVPALYSAADVCVFPSIREGQGLAAIEGMAAGLPLIAADNRGTREFMDEESGIVCNADRPEQFAAAIKTMKENPEFRKHCGTGNRRKSERFSVDRVNRRMKELYGQCEGNTERTGHENAVLSD